MEEKRMTVKQKAKQVAKLLRSERPDYFYLKELFRHLRKELNVIVQQQPKKLPYVPTEEEVNNYYETVWNAQNVAHMVLIKILLYTGIRVGELIKLKMEDVYINKCQIKIIDGKGHKDRMVPFPKSFREVLVAHIKSNKEKNAIYLFESIRKGPYTDRGIRKILVDYSKKAKLKHEISPHKLRHFLFTWMKKKGVDDALIQPYSGHESRKSLEVYSKLSITEAQNKYNDVINEFPI
ncbi:MAG: site-specific integrase [Rickettsiales bacterium]|jgi:integrase/recombinase XerD|nr:site-specific integrase [Rickettsiales bacterium]